VLSVVGAVLLVGGFVWLWWQGVPALYRSAELAPVLAPGTKLTAADQLKAITDTRTALLAGLAALAALAGLTFTARTYRLTQQGQLTDRYTKAIAQLGDAKPDVRLGGIYALEQLATNSDKVRDQATIVEVLSAFVRMHSDPVFRYRNHLSWLRQKRRETDEKEERDKAEQHVARYSLPVDVQAAVTVLGRLHRAGKADLSGAWLKEVQLAGADLTRANLGLGADRRPTNLTGANLTGANLTGANLTGANLTGADLTGAILGATVSKEKKLAPANLAGAKLSNALIGGALWGERTIWPSPKLRDEIRNVSNELGKNDEHRNDLYGCDHQVREGYNVGPGGDSVCCPEPAPPTQQS
jgi:hypothetical protein